MELKILYFGMIAEITHCSEEILSVDNDSMLFQVEKLLKNKYQRLHNLSFNIAIDQEILSSNVVLKPNNEIALLPPFSGG